MEERVKVCLCCDNTFLVFYYQQDGEFEKEKEVVCDRCGWKFLAPKDGELKLIEMPAYLPIVMEIRRQQKEKENSECIK